MAEEATSVPHQPFRHLRIRSKVAIGPESWLPLNDRKEATYNLRLINGVYQMPMHNVRALLLKQINCTVVVQ